MESSDAKKINILYITTSVSTQGGIEQTLGILCRYLDPTLFRIGLCSINDSPKHILAEFKNMDIEVFALHRKAAFFDAVTLWKLMQVINTFDANIVHTHNNKANWHGRLAAAWSKKVAIVTTHHDLGDDISDIKKRIYTYHSSDWVADILYPLANRLLNGVNTKIICVSKAVQEVYTKSMDNRYEVVYAPYDEQLFNPQARYTSNIITLGIVGRLVWQKGHQILLQALPSIIQEYPCVRLKIIGRGELEQSLRQYVNQHNLTPYVDFCGNLEHGAALYESIDIYLQPSVSEGCSITILEAMASQIPVISTNQGGPKEIIVSGENGILVTPMDSLSLQQAIIDLIKHPGKANQLAQAGYKTAQQNFGSRSFIKKMTEIYQQAVSR